MSHQAEISYLTLSEALQEAFVRQRTGVLGVATEDRRERFYFLGGQLYLSGENPCRELLERVLAGPPSERDEPRFDARAYLARELGEVVRELGEALASWSVGELRFTDTLGDVPEDIVGPVPTATLVMDLSSRGWTVEDLLRRLGGAGARYRAAADAGLRKRVPDLDAEEIALLERLEETVPVAMLLAEGEDASAVLCRLVRLTAVGLAEAVSEPARAASISREVLERISERVREDLEDKPLELDRKLHQARVRKLLDEYGRLGFFELLRVEGDASSEEVHAAFMEVARLAHPVHAEVLGLVKSRRKLEWLMARLTEAYLVLSDPVRSAEHRRTMGVAPPMKSSVPDEEARRSERAGLARQTYREALNHVEEHDYFFAIQLLGQAVRIDPRPEYYALLGHCQMQNPKWLHMAVDSLRRGVALRPDDEKLRAELAEASAQYRVHREELERERDPTRTELDRDETRARRILSKLRRGPD